MFSQRRFFAASLVFCGLVLGACAPSAAQDGLHRAASLYGICGQVARPGVYEAPGKTVPLREFLEEYAGGLTTQASGTVRVIRQGRVVHQIYFTGTSRYDLLPGDLAVVDSFSGGRQSLAITPSQSVAASAGGSTVQLAFVDLLDRPVVMKVRREHATRANIVALLQQGPRCLAAVREIRPPGTSVGDHNDPSLPSGTVLAFDRTLVDVQRLPELPGIIRPEQPAASPPTAVSDGAIIPAQPVSIAPGSLNAIAPPTPIEVPLPEDGADAGPVIAALGPNSGPAATDSLPKPAAAFPGENRAGASVPRELTAGALPSADARPARRMAMHAPWSLDDRFEDTSRTSAAEAAGTAPGQPAAQNSPSEGQSRSAYGALRTLAYLARLVRGESPFPGQAIMAIACVAVLAAGWMLISMARTVPVPQRSKVQHETASPRPLQALISNRLPILEEPPVVPEGMQFYGRPPATPMWREDAVEERIESPHFEIRLPTAARQERPAPEKLDVVKPVPRAAAPPAGESATVRMDQRHEARSPAARPRERHAAGEAASTPVTTAQAIDGSRAARALERALSERDLSDRNRGEGS